MKITRREVIQVLNGKHKWLKLLALMLHAKYPDERHDRMEIVDTRTNLVYTTILYVKFDGTFGESSWDSHRAVLEQRLKNENNG